jgi:biopolymer transport protein ExbD
MSMSAGGGGGLNADPNVTPMIDVLMVLLIIFMVIVPSSRKALVEVLPGGQYTVNKQPVQAAALAQRLKEIYDPRPDKIIFVKGDPQVKYQDVIKAMDIARGSGVKVIGVPPKEASS